MKELPKFYIECCPRVGSIREYPGALDVENDDIFFRCNFSEVHFNFKCTAHPMYFSEHHRRISHYRCSVDSHTAGTWEKLFDDCPIRKRGRQKC